MWRPISFQKSYKFDNFIVLFHTFLMQIMSNKTIKWSKG